MFISVDLPEPDEPMIATNSPRWTVRLTPRSASTSTSPMTKVRVTFSTLMTGCANSFLAALSDYHLTGAARQAPARLLAAPAALGGDDPSPGWSSPCDDLGEVPVVEPGNDGDRDRLTSRSTQTRCCPLVGACRARPPRGRRAYTAAPGRARAARCPFDRRRSAVDAVIPGISARSLLLTPTTTS